MAKLKYYVVWEGHQPGIYSSWPACQEATHHYPSAKFKAYDSEQEAQQAFKQGWKKSFQLAQSATKTNHSSKAVQSKKAGQSAAGIFPEIDLDSISVDVGCSGNPGIVEYKGVDTRTGEVIFHQGPIGKGTNNLGEFLAIVHALAYLQSQGSSKTIYTDSVTALSWIRNKNVSTNLERDDSTKEIWSLVDRAIDWLHQHRYSNKIIKWDTKKYGEIKADFGRK
jgi:ribonuclease HI